MTTETPNHVHELSQHILEAHRDGQLKALSIQHDICENANLHPAVAISIAAVVILMVWLAMQIYKPGVTGEWYSTDGVSHYFKQTGDTLEITRRGVTYLASLKDGIFRFGHRVGVYDGHKRIDCVNDVSYYKI
jgi:hypothetical protein